MKKLTIALIVILVIILAAVLKGSFSINFGSNSTDTSTNATGPIRGLEVRENSEGPVTVTVTPLNLEQNSTTWDFEISLNTHSEELNMDLVSVSTLVVEPGKSYNPILWEGAPPGGHHRSGVLKFNPISPRPKSIELVIKDIGGVPERSFKWEKIN